MAGAALKLEGVSKRYGGNAALESVSMDVDPGELRAVIGPNGAGKSTLFGVVAGEHAPSAGRVYLDSRDVTLVPAHRRVRLGIARAFQVSRVFPSLTVEDNILAALLARDGDTRTFWRGINRTKRDRSLTLLREIGLESVAPRRAATLAQGDRKRLEIAMALALGARLLLLDEPTAGMSPDETRATVELLHRLWSAGELTVVLTEHDMDVVFRLAQRVTVLHRGRVMVTGTPEDVRARTDVREIYLGTR